MAKPNLFQQLTRLFKSGPVVKRKVKNLDTTVAMADRMTSSGVLLMQRSALNTYNNLTNAYNIGDRLARYQDFQEMELTPELAAALDLFADETVSPDEKNRVLHVYSDDEKIRETLYELFYGTLNIEFNLRHWVRNLPVHKDTPVALLDGRNITIEQLSQEHKSGKENWVYSVQDGTHRIVPGKVTWCDLTKKDSEIIRITLDDGTYVDCDPEHEWIMRDGTKKQAQHLVPNDSMMPFYRKGNSLAGDEQIYDPSTGIYVCLQHVLFEKSSNLKLESLYQNTAWNGEKSAVSFSTLESILNHKVVSVERLTTRSDVYCMDVRGPNGEHDRHNFMVLGRSVETDEVCVFSGVCSQNCKYGDLFLLHDVSPQYGLIGAHVVPINEIEREEGYDETDPFAVRFRWAGTVNRTLENWEISHFRLLGNDSFLPYGSSMVEPARRIWRQLVLAEDAMLVYRVTRAPERRVHYIDVGNVGPDEVENYMEEQKRMVRTNQVVDAHTGRVDLRYNPFCISLKSFIKLQDGRYLTLQQIIDEWNEGKRDHWVHSVDLEGKCLAPGKIVWAGVTRKDAEMVRVHIDDGSHFDVTPDHKFMLRDGSYRRADELEPDTSLMPLYVSHTSKLDGHKIVGYEKTYDPFTQKHVLTHRLNVISIQGFEKIKGKIIHHADFNKLNNNPENLVPMSWREHHKLHGEQCVVYNKSDIGRRNSKNRFKKTWSEGKITPQTFVELWKNEEIRSKRVNALTLQLGDKFIDHCMRILDESKKGYSLKEPEFLERLNSDDKFVSYIKSLNPRFKNGFTTMTRGSFQSRLISLGFNKAYTDLKRNWLLQKHDLNDIIAFCQKTQKCSRKQILEKFKLTRTEFCEILRLSGYDINTFNRLYAPGSLRYTRKKNHRVVKIEKLASKEDTGCVTVESHHNFAVFGQNNDGSMANSGIFVKNSIDEDYWIPVRGNESATRVDTLAGGQNIAAVEDVAYLRDKLFTALKIPKAYLGYVDGAGSKASLAQLDIRFSRTIQSIQKVVVSELNKMAIIHLYARGISGEDLLNFTLNLSNPSTVATQQKLELWRTRFEISGLVAESPFASRRFVRQDVWGLSEDEMRQIDDDRYDEKIIDAAIEEATSAGTEGEGEGAEPGAGGLGADLGSLATGGEGEEAEPTEEPETEEPETAGTVPVGRLIADSDDETIDEFKARLDVDKLPSKVAQHIMYNRARRRHHGSDSTQMPNLNRMSSTKTPSTSDPYDSTWLKSVTSNPLADGVLDKPVLTTDVKNVLREMDWKLFGGREKRLVEQLEPTKQQTVVEGNDVSDDVIIEIEED